MGDQGELVKVDFRRAFYLLVIAAVLMLSLAPSKAFAVRPTSLKDTLSDSRPSTASNHEMVLDLSGSTTFIAGETVIVTFPAGYDLTALTMTDVDFQNGATDETLQAGACGATDTVQYVLASQVVTFTACSSYTAEAASTAITMQFGSNAAGGTTRIVNTTAGTSQLNVAGTYGDDSQDTVLVLTAGVAISATIDEVLTLTVAGLAADANCTTTGGTKPAASTATTIPYGTINTETFYDICQELTVATNAGTGYTVTVYTVAGLDAGANAFAVGSCDGACTLTDPAAWATATFNGYAICMDDTTGNAAETANADWVAAGQCGGASQQFELVADLSSQTPSTIMQSAVGVTDISKIGWRLSADGAQAAGAYTGTADYITTGTF